MEIMAKSEDEIIDEFLEVFARDSILVGGKNQQGMSSWIYPRLHPAEGSFYFSVPFINTLWETLKKLEERGKNPEDIAKLFEFPSKIADITFQFSSIKKSQLSSQEGKELAMKLFRYINNFRDDIFCVKGRNLLWDKRKIKNIVKNEFTKNVDFNVSKFNALMTLFSDTLFFIYPRFGREIHGPYQTEDGLLIVRNYHDLNPDYLPFLRDLKYRQLKTYELYKNIDISINFFNMIKTEKQLPKHLVNFSMEVNGEGINDELMTNIIEEIEEYHLKTIDYFKSLPQKEFIKKFAECVFYVLKPLRLELNQDWKPPKEVYRKIEKRGPPKDLREEMRKVKGMSENKRIKTIKKLFDPRK